MTERVLLIDDDVYIHQVFQKVLPSSDFSIEIATNGKEGLRKAYEFKPDVILLDIMMPGMDGWDTCTRLREISDVPIIMLTALSQQKDVVKGLSIGADDYITKPADISEVVARIRAVIRRSNSEADEEQTISCGHLSIDLTKRQVVSNGARVDLSPTEFRLLSLLAKNKGKVLPRDFLLSKVWGPEYTNQKQYLHIYINYLRTKIESNPNKPHLISTVRSVGYRFG